MKEVNFDLEGVTFKNLPAQSVDSETYSALYEAEYDAFSAAIPSMTSKMGHYYFGSPSTYEKVRRNPNLLVISGRAFPNQSYRRPEVTIAYADGKPIGSAYCADNVAGPTVKERLFKQMTFIHNYRTLRSISVHPDYQGRGIAHTLAFKAYLSPSSLQPGSAYTYPELLPRMDSLLRSWGFEPTNLDEPSPVNPFGNKDIDQIRYQVKRASTISSRIGEIMLDSIEDLGSPLSLLVEHH